MNSFDKLMHKPSKEQKLANEKFNHEINVINEELEVLLDNLVGKGLMTQSLTQAPQHLVNAVNKRIMKTVLFKTGIENKQKLDSTPLNELELIEEKS